MIGTAEARLDQAARALDRARAIAERRPDDGRAHLAHVEALAAYEAARAEVEAARARELRARNAALQHGLRRAVEALRDKQALIDRYGGLSGATRRLRRIAARDEAGALLPLLDGTDDGQGRAA